jgi:hypothetical protein
MKTEKTRKVTEYMTLAVFRLLLNFFPLDGYFFAVVLVSDADKICMQQKY